MKKNVFVKYLVYSIIILVCVELGLRLLGYSGTKPFPVLISQISPSGSINGDPLVGYSFQGNSKVSYKYKSGYHFIANHDANGTRICDSDSSENELSIHFYGGSLFYGMGLNDTSVFTSKLAKSMKNVRIKNHAIFAHSMVSSYLLLKRQIANNSQPDCAVVTYASYNLERNVYAWKFRRNLYGNSNSLGKKNISYVFARLNSDNQLSFKCDDFGYSPFWTSKYSAMSNLLERGIENNQDEKLQSNKVEKKLFQMLIDLCEENQIELIFACVNSDTHVDNIMRYFEKNDVRYINIFVDYQQSKYNQLPHDNHPNDLAHSIYARKLKSYLENVLSLN